LLTVRVHVTSMDKEKKKYADGRAGMRVFLTEQLGHIVIGICIVLSTISCDLYCCDLMHVSV